MNETSQESISTWCFLRRYIGRIVIGAILVVATFGAMLVVLPYEREQRIAKRIQATGGQVQFVDRCPNWLLHAGIRLPLFRRIYLIQGRYGTTIPADLASEFRVLADLEVLDIPYSGLTDAGLEQLHVCKRLNTLVLGHTPITDAGLKNLKGLNHLSYVNLRNTQITDAGIKDLKQLTSLVTLNISMTRITDDALSQLNQLPILTTLDINSTEVTNAGLEHLKGMTSLQSLRVDNTSITPMGAAMFQESLPTCFVRFRER